MTAQATTHAWYAAIHHVLLEDTLTRLNEVLHGDCAVAQAVSALSCIASQP